MVVTVLSADVGTFTTIMLVVVPLMVVGLVEVYATDPDVTVVV